MNSQVDIFADLDSNKKKIIYDFVVLCDKDEEAKHPFGLYPRSMFSDSEIPEKWLESKLDESSRLKTIPTLEGIGNNNFALFGKFEEGLVQYF